MQTFWTLRHGREQIQFGTRRMLDAFKTPRVWREVPRTIYCYRAPRAKGAEFLDTFKKVLDYNAATQ
jgi:hypothetical protein